MLIVSMYPSNILVMRKPLLIAGIVLLFQCHQLSAQINLNWATSYAPSWANGALSRTATNIGGNSINCTSTVSMNGPGSFTLAMGSSGSQTPTVSGAVFTVPGATNRLQLTPNFNQNTSYVNTVLSFTAMTTNVSFRIVDIDKNDAFSVTYFDRVTITGSDGSTTFNPTLTKYDATTDPNFLIISGNSAWVNTTGGQAGNTASDASDQRGTITVSFGSAVINSITIRYDNAAGANNNPAAQSIAIGQVSFTQSTLPVTLTSLGGYRSGENVILNWITKQEYNSAAFEIERNTGNNWETIGTVAAAGFSSSDRHYSFTDRNPGSGLLLYRLKQTDIDNHYKYSAVVRIHSAGAAADLKVYPNPFREHISIGLYSFSQQKIQLSITDAGGRVVQSETRNLFAGSNNMMMITGTLAKGLYYVTARDEAGNLLGHTKIFRD